MRKIHMKQNIIEYSNDMKGVYKNVEEYNIGKKRKISITFDDMITDCLLEREN